MLRLDGQPLPHVTLEIGSGRTRTDRTGRFLLELPGAASGWQEVLIEGTTANRPGAQYGIFEVAVQLVGGETAALPYTIWMPRLDMANAVRIESTSRESWQNSATVSSDEDQPGRDRDRTRSAGDALLTRTTAAATSPRCRSCTAPSRQAMMIWLIPIGLSVAALLWLVLWYGSRTPWVHRVSSADLPGFMDQLLRRGYNGAFAVVEDSEKKAFVHVVKYILSDRRMGLRLSVPVAPWSEAALPRIKAMLQGRAVSLEEMGEAPVRAFLWCDFGDDATSAAQFVDRILRDAFVVDTTSPYRVTLTRISPRYEIISERSI